MYFVGFYQVGQYNYFIDSFLLNYFLEISDYNFGGVYRYKEIDVLDCYCLQKYSVYQIGYCGRVLKI